MFCLYLLTMLGCMYLSGILLIPATHCARLYVHVHVCEWDRFGPILSTDCTHHLEDVDFVVVTRSYDYCVHVPTGKFICQWVSRATFTHPCASSLHRRRRKVQGVLLLVSHMTSGHASRTKSPWFMILSLFSPPTSPPSFLRDSFWIIRGLLLCDMRETAKNMILNMISMVERWVYSLLSMPDSNA